ncbi:hypothetical protein [Pseudaestuariivita atlantica]|uniref:DUF4157 domain-containing protein n=1 Tax=Pseudaestuariivita atlantica TaxID=1317121 RepID=A0A0L1JQZ6_9RHOB|nr:hypothetical protein [Pseudaestuariivita atlantica]KNG94214.1 hypothetical protein ATO11_08305 [Pseudaestuariivita atlantica]
MALRLVLSCLLLLVAASCGRPLTEAESRFARAIHGDQVDLRRVRLVNNAPVRAYTFRIPKRPRVTCQERIFPPPQTDILTGAPAAVVLFNRIYFNRDFWLDEYVPDYPERLHLFEAMLLGHELTHVWQWQNRARTGYHPLKAAREHGASDDPYLFDPDTPRAFLDFGYEQQGAIVEEYICCSALDPDAPRTARLHQMIAQEFPISRLPRVDTILPWNGARVDGICRR